MKKKQPGQAELLSYVHVLVFSSPFCEIHALMYERQTNTHANALEVHNVIDCRVQQQFSFEMQQILLGLIVHSI